MLDRKSVAINNLINQYSKHQIRVRAPVDLFIYQLLLIKTQTNKCLTYSVFGKWSQEFPLESALMQAL